MEGACMTDEEFSTIWRQTQGKGEEDKKAPCPIAAEFLKKVEEVLFHPLGTGATRGKVAQAKYMLQEEYHTWRKSMPAHHSASASRHSCLADVYERCYDRLHLLELSLRPTMPLILEYEEHVAMKLAPPVPQPSPPPQIAGIFIGEHDDD